MRVEAKYCYFGAVYAKVPDKAIVHYFQLAGQGFFGNVFAQFRNRNVFCQQAHFQVACRQQHDHIMYFESIFEVRRMTTVIELSRLYIFLVDRRSYQSVNFPFLKCFHGKFQRQVSILATNIVQLPGSYFHVLFPTVENVGLFRIQPHQVFHYCECEIDVW